MEWQLEVEERGSSCSLRLMKHLSLFCYLHQKIHLIHVFHFLLVFPMTQLLEILQFIDLWLSQLLEVQSILHKQSHLHSPPSFHHVIPQSHSNHLPRLLFLLTHPPNFPALLTTHFQVFLHQDCSLSSLLLSTFSTSRYQVQVLMH